MKSGLFNNLATRLLFSLVVCATLALPSMALAAYLVDPIVHYKLEEDPASVTDPDTVVFMDANGTGKTGTCSDCPTTATGIVGQALSFDGSGNIVTVATDSSAGDILNIGVETSVSVVAWVKRENTTISNREIIVGRYASGGMVIWLSIEKNGGPAFNLRDSKGVGENARRIYSTTSVADGQWHLVAGVYNATDAKMLIYVDGVEAGATDPTLSPVTFTAGFESDSAPLVIGALNTSKDSPFNGLIDEVAFLKQPLTAQALASNYAAGVQGKDYEEIFGPVIQPTLGGTGYVGYPFGRQVSLVGNLLPANPVLSLTASPVDMTIGLDPDPAGFIAWTPTSAQAGDNIVSVAGTSDGAAPVSADFVVAVKDLCSLDMASYWSFEDDDATFNDATPNSQILTCVACPITAENGGAVGKALTFNGSTTFLKVDPDASALLDLSLGQSLSLAAWVKRENSISDNEVIIGRDAASTGSMKFWLGLTDTGAPAFRLTDGSGADSARQITGGTAIADGAWHHVVGVYDADLGQLRIYVDGVEAGTPEPASFTIGLISNNAPLVIGALNTVPQHVFEGDIDEVAFIKDALDEDMADKMVQNSGADKGYFCQTPPEITSGAADSTIAAGASFTYSATAKDDDDSDLFWTLFNSPAGMSVGTDGVVTWTPASGVTTSGLVTLRVDDNFGGSDSLEFTVTVTGGTSANQVPTITGQKKNPIVIAVDSAREITLADLDASDPDGDAIELDTVGAGDNYTVSGFTITPAAGYTGSLTVPVTVTDGTDSSSAFNLDIEVGVLGIVSTAGDTVTAGQIYTYTPEVSNSQGSELTWSLSGEPAGMTVDAASGVVTWTPAADVTTSGAVTLSVTDGTDTASETFTITVSNGGPDAPGGGGGGGGGCFIASVGNASSTLGLLSFGLLGTLVAFLPRR